MIAARLSSGALQKQETGVGADFFLKKNVVKGPLRIGKSLYDPPTYGGWNT